MKVKLKRSQGTVLVTREKGDLQIKDESHLLYRVKQELILQGYDVIKKLMWKDGHMVAETQHYIRTRKAKPYNFAIYDPYYAIRDAAEIYQRSGYVTFSLVRDVLVPFNRQNRGLI